MISLEEKQAAMKTARSAGAVSGKAIVPRVVRSMAFKDETCILDYGCGKDQLHVLSLRSEGYVAYGYDFSLPESKSNLGASYDIVYLSNVLNVQSSLGMLFETLQEVRNLTWKAANGKAVINYPASPRKLGINVTSMENILKTYFGHVVRLPKSQVGNNVVWCCQFPQFGG